MQIQHARLITRFYEKVKVATGVRPEIDSEQFDFMR